jgi:hypothetical protein
LAECSGQEEIIFFADIVKLPLTGANVVPIRSNKKFSGGVEPQARARISAFNRLGSPSRNLAPVRCNKMFSAGMAHQSRIRISAFNRLGSPAPDSWFSSSRRRVVPPRISNSRRVFSSQLNPEPLGDVHSGGIRGRSKFQNSNFNWTWPRNLQWCPVRSRGPAGPLGPPAFRCHFYKVRGHLELFCPSKKSSFGFPLASFPAFGS